jgi:hypothetical protein
VFGLTLEFRAQLISKTNVFDITETLDSKSNIGQHLAKNGFSVYHVARGVDNLRQVAQDRWPMGFGVKGYHAKPTRLHRDLILIRKIPSASGSNWLRADTLVAEPTSSQGTKTC